MLGLLGLSDHRLKSGGMIVLSYGKCVTTDRDCTIELQVIWMQNGFASDKRIRQVIQTQQIKVKTVKKRNTTKTLLRDVKQNTKRQLFTYGCLAMYLLQSINVCLCYDNLVPVKSSAAIKFKAKTKNFMQNF